MEGGVSRIAREACAPGYDEFAMKIRKTFDSITRAARDAGREMNRLREKALHDALNAHLAGGPRYVDVHIATMPTDTGIRITAQTRSIESWDEPPTWAPCDRYDLHVELPDPNTYRYDTYTVQLGGMQPTPKTELPPVGSLHAREVHFVRRAHEEDGKRVMRWELPV
jgi:hypothetical protein